MLRRSASFRCCSSPSLPTALPLLARLPAPTPAPRSRLRPAPGPVEPPLRPSGARSATRAIAAALGSQPQRAGRRCFAPSHQADPRSGPGLARRAAAQGVPTVHYAAPPGIARAPRAVHYAAKRQPRSTSSGRCPATIHFIGDTAQPPGRARSCSTYFVVVDGAGEPAPRDLRWSAASTRSQALAAERRPTSLTTDLHLGGRGAPGPEARLQLRRRRPAAASGEGALAGVGGFDKSVADLPQRRGRGASRPARSSCAGGGTCSPST
jgi:hypothetical protein